VVSCGWAKISQQIGTSWIRVGINDLLLWISYTRQQPDLFCIRLYEEVVVFANGMKMYDVNSNGSSRKWKDRGGNGFEKILEHKNKNRTVCSMVSWLLVLMS